MKSISKVLFTAMCLCLLVSGGNSPATAGPPEIKITSDPGGFLPKEMLERINCRVGRKTAEGGFEIYNDVEINTISKNPIDYAFETKLPNGKALGVMVNHIGRREHGDQFGVRMFEDRELIFKTARSYMEIYYEFRLDPGPLYLVHCFPPIE